MGHDEQLGVGSVRRSYPRLADSGSRDDVARTRPDKGGKKSMVPPLERSGSNPVRARLAQLVAIEQLIADSLDGWADRVREHPEATALVDRLRTISASQQPLEPALDATAGPPGRAGSPVPGVAGGPPRHPTSYGRSGRSLSRRHSPAKPPIRRLGCRLTVILATSWRPVSVNTPPRSSTHAARCPTSWRGNSVELA
jgi:hypothetical protein